MTQACIGNACVDAVGTPADYVAARGDRDASLLVDVILPAVRDPTEDCCFDFTGDGNPDDALGAYARIIAGFGSTDPQALTTDSVDDGALATVFDWVALPLPDGRARVSVFDGTLAGAHTPADRRAGLGEVTLDEGSFQSPYGAAVQANDAVIEAGTLRARLARLLVPVVVFDDPPLLMPATDVLVELELEACGDGICTNTTADVPPVPAARVGGLVSFPAYVDEVDAVLRTCQCADIDVAVPVLMATLTTDDGWQVDCNTSNMGDGGASCGAGDPFICTSIDAYCATTGLLESVIDVDTDADAWPDAFSVGYRFGLAPVAITGVTP